ncbi:MAG: hypothetical protein Q4D13_04990 [Erysipelotrichaceae bacterium]|nr:hypothetical protein [Erysipelotrichaceae bacterium]
MNYEGMIVKYKNYELLEEHSHKKYYCFLAYPNGREIPVYFNGVREYDKAHTGRKLKTILKKYVDHLPYAEDKQTSMRRPLDIVEII